MKLTTPTAHVLAFDVSSKFIGLAHGVISVEGSRIIHSETIKLDERLPLDRRVREAHRAVSDYIAESVHSLDLVVYEAPVARYAASVIAQSQCVGAVISAFSDTDVDIQPISPADSKKALAGNGSANKLEMLAAAARVSPKFGFQIRVRDRTTPEFPAGASVEYHRTKTREEFRHAGWQQHNPPSEKVLTEHEADAIGLVCAAQQFFSPQLEA